MSRMVMKEDDRLDIDLLCHNAFNLVALCRTLHEVVGGQNIPTFGLEIVRTSESSVYAESTPLRGHIVKTNVT